MGISSFSPVLMQLALSCREEKGENYPKVIWVHTVLTPGGMKAAVEIRSPKVNLVFVHLRRNLLSPRLGHVKKLENTHDPQFTDETGGKLVSAAVSVLLFSSITFGMRSRASVTVMVTWVCVKESSNIQSGWRDGKVNLGQTDSLHLFPISVLAHFQRAGQALDCT